VNRLKVWIFTLLVAAAGAAGLRAHVLTLREDALAGLDARLSAAASHVGTALHAALREAAAAAALAAREPALRAALAPRGDSPPLPRKKGKPASQVDPAKDDAAQQAAAEAALAAAEGALGGSLPAGRMVVAASQAALSRRPVGGDSDALLRGAAEGTARAAFARGDGKLWAAAGAPAGDAAGVAVLVPLGEAWARAVTAAAGVDVTLSAPDVKAVGTARASDVASVVGAAPRAAAAAIDVGTLAPVDVGVKVIPVQLPRVGPLLDRAPALRVRAVPVEGMKGAAVVLSTPAATALAPIVALEWRGLAALVALLLVGLVFGFLVRPSEIVPAVPEVLVAAASRIERGEFDARAPQLAGKLGTIAAALNRAAEAAEGASGGSGHGGQPAPEFINSPLPPAQAPEAEPSAFEFPARPPRRGAEPPAPPSRATGLTGDPFQAAPVAPIGGDNATPAEVLQAAARSAPPPMPAPRTTTTGIPAPKVTMTMPAMGGGDDEQAHWQQVFQDFLRTRAECGEPAEGLTFERFRAKLEQNKANLVAKYNCKTVRFQVYVKEGKAALKATPVR